MDIYRIKGGKKLSGEVEISGAKNAALPIIVACMLADGESVLRNVPDLMDIRTIIKVLEFLGAEIDFNKEKKIVRIQVNKIKNGEVPYELVKTMRASVYVMGPLLARTGEAYVSLPGGCAIGERPVDIHLSGFEAMGAEITLEHGYIKATAAALKGTSIIMRKISVGATANLMMAAALAKGKTILENCALEPDIVDLGNFLIKMGAVISGLGTDRIEIEGVSKLNPVNYTIIPDRIEAGTFLIAGAITRGNITLKNVIPAHIKSLTETLGQIGFDIKEDKNSVHLGECRKLKGAMIRTLPFPGFPTDLQAPVMSLMTSIPGISVVIETIFENRFTHIPELRRMGADITIENNIAVINGGQKLSSAPVMMSDLRAGAALIIAALGAKGTTEIRRIYHSDRGYEKLSEKLSGLGADIVRVKGGNP